MKDKYDLMCDRMREYGYKLGWFISEKDTMAFYIPNRMLETLIKVKM